MSVVVVFGGSGFIGSHVVDELLNEGYLVRVADVYKSTFLDERCSFYRTDVLDKLAIDEVIDGADIVYNFAAISDLREASNDPVKSAEINIIGNINILDCAIKQGVKQYIYASSVYAASQAGSFYKCTKIAGESYVKEYHQKFGLNYLIFRYGSIYGPRSDARNGIYRYVREAIETGKIEYTGDLEAVREYVHVGDAAVASVQVLQRGFANQTLVLTGQESIKVLDMLYILLEIIGLDADRLIISEKLNSNGHYGKTPYFARKETPRVFVPSAYISLGEGLSALAQSFYDDE